MATGGSTTFSLTQWIHGRTGAGSGAGSGAGASSGSGSGSGAQSGSEGAPGRERVSTLESLEESKLIARVSDNRDEQAFRELVRRHESRVRALLMRLSGGNGVLADDLAQEVFLRAFRGLEAFEGRSKFSTWLYRIAYNVYLNHRSRAKELSPLPKHFEPAQDSRIGCGDPGVADLRRDLEKAIATLPPRYRSVLVLFYLEEISYPEIAEVLDLPLGTVKTHLHRAKKMLKSQLSSWK